MKLVKRLLAVVLTLALVLSFAGCHKKNETAIKVDETEFSGAFYMCCLINADMEAKDKIDAEKAAEATEETAETTETTDYYAEKIDDLDYATWVESRAIKMCKLFVYYIEECKKAGIEITDADLSQYDQMSDYYWNYYGYSTLFEPNGVGFETYKKFNQMSVYEEKYFEYLYGKDGTTPVTDEEITESFNTQYAAIYSLSETVDTAEEGKEEEVKAKFESFKTRLQKGAKWEDIYTEYKGEPLTAQEGGASDPYVTIVGDDTTSYYNEIWETVNDMQIGEIEVVVDEHDSGTITLVKKVDQNSEPYFKEQLDSSIRYALKYDDFVEESQAVADGYDETVVKSAVKIFKVEKIKYPENAQ